MKFYLAPAIILLFGISAVAKERTKTSHRDVEVFYVDSSSCSFPTPQEQNRKIGELTQITGYTASSKATVTLCKLQAEQSQSCKSDGNWFTFGDETCENIKDTGEERWVKETVNIRGEGIARASNPNLLSYMARTEASIKSGEEVQTMQADAAEQAHSDCTNKLEETIDSYPALETDIPDECQ